MMAAIRQWLNMKWQAPDRQALMQSYAATFSTAAGQRVLTDLLDSVYCTVCPTNDPNDLIAHNARRRLVHELLQTLDAIENPTKYQLSQSDEEALRSYGVDR